MRILAVVLIVMLAGCTRPDPQPGVDLNFAAYGILPLKVAHIDVVEDYVPLATPPYIQNSFAVPPDQAIRRWVADRLRADGGEDDLMIDITEADVTEEALPLEGGIVGALTDQQNRQWTAHLSATFSLRSLITGHIVATASFNIKHLRTTSQSASESDIREAQAELIREAMDDFNKMATQTLQQDMPQVLETATR